MELVLHHETPLNVATDIVLSIVIMYEVQLIGPLVNQTLAQDADGILERMDATHPRPSRILQHMEDNLFFEDLRFKGHIRRRLRGLQRDWNAQHR